MVRLISFPKKNKPQTKKPQTHPNQKPSPETPDLDSEPHNVFFWLSRYFVSHHTCLVTSALCLLSVACSADTLLPKICSKYFSVVFRPVPKPGTVFIICCCWLWFACIVLLACYVCLSVNFFLFFSS